MKKITSFTIDHNKLQPGVYVSRKDKFNEAIITTFDLRITSPNEEPVINTGELHAIEHLGATYLRNDTEFKESILYFGPMGCRTGYYLLLKGDYVSSDIIELLKRTFEFISTFEGEIPGATEKDCGNCHDMNLNMAKYYGRKYLAILENISDEQLIYPE